MNGHCSQGVACNTQVPGPVDNVPLVEPETRKVSLKSCSFGYFFSCYIIQFGGGLLVSFTVILIEALPMIFAISCHLLLCINMGAVIN